jgi:hypothetical protein
MEVELGPLVVFIQQPEYWGIEVVGRLPGGIRLPALTPYDASISLSGITGSKRNEVIGATRSKRMEGPPAEPVTEPQSSSDANPFYLRGGEGVRITYGILRASGAFHDYQDRQRTLSFSGRDGEIDSLEAGICRMLTIELHREDAMPMLI